jgi:hypothetical protein
MGLNTDEVSGVAQRIRCAIFMKVNTLKTNVKVKASFNGQVEMFTRGNTMRMRDTA